MKKLKYKRAIQGIILSFGAPSGAIIIKLMFGSSLNNEYQLNLIIYIYMLFSTMLVFSLFGYHIGKHEDTLEKFSLIDSLTKIYNHRYFQKRLSEEVSNYLRNQINFSLIILDIDFFKKINDNYGHPFGDKVLIETASLIQSISRKHDIVARVGGEEFAIILNNCNLENSKNIVKRYLEAIRNNEIILNLDHKIKITVSAGLASTENFYNVNEKSIYSEADKALYKSKENGRNKYTVAIK